MFVLSTSIEKEAVRHNFLQERCATVNGGKKLYNRYTPWRVSIIRFMGIVFYLLLSKRYFPEPILSMAIKLPSKIPFWGMPLTITDVSSIPNSGR